MTTFEIPDDIDLAELGQPAESEVSYAPGSRADCPKCGKDCHVNADGTLRAHTCGDVLLVRNRTKGKAKAKRDKTVPPSVMKLGTAAIASGVEWGAARYIASIVPCKPAQVPKQVYEIDDATDMVAPIVKLLWPQIPGKAQSVIAAICDNEDLIVCALAWIDWTKKIDTWAHDAHRELTAALAEQARNQPQPQGADNVFPITTQGPRPESVEPVGGWPEPFSPEAL